MSESPERFQEKFRLLDEKLRLGSEKYGRFESLDDPDETDDEGSQNGDTKTDTVIKRSNSYLELSSIKDKSFSGHSLCVAGASLKERRKSSPADFVDGKSGEKMFEACERQTRNNLVQIKINDDTS